MPNHHTFKVTKILAVYPHNNKWYAQVEAQGPRGEKVDNIAFAAKSEAEGCVGYQFKVS